MAPFPVKTVVLKRQVRRNMEEDENVIDVMQRSPHTKAHNSARLSLPHMTVCTTSHTEGLHPYHWQPIQQLELQPCWNSAIFT